MSASYDPTPPPWAALIWHDGFDLFVQLPKSNHITKLSLSEGGLTKALKLIQKPCKAPVNGHKPAKPITKADKYDQATRNAAREAFLKAMK